MVMVTMMMKVSMTRMTMTVTDDHDDDDDDGHDDDDHHNDNNSGYQGVGESKVPKEGDRYAFLSLNDL